MRRYLVVANKTLGGEHMLEKVRELVWHGPCTFHILVPATPPARTAVWTEGEAKRVAQSRLDHGIEAFRSVGVEATGEVGDYRPLYAVLDALRSQPFDEVIVSTLPPGISRWIRADLPHRVGRVIGRPVIHIVAEKEAAFAT